MLTKIRQARGLAAGTAIALALPMMATWATSGPAFASAPARRAESPLLGAVPAGLNPTTPRPNWDACDEPYSLSGISFGTPVGEKSKPWTMHARGFQLVAPQTDPKSPNYAPFPANAPSPAYVACTVTGPLMTPNNREPLPYTAHVTNVSHAVVYAAGISFNYHGTGASTWLNADWRKLAPGQGTTFSAVSSDNFPIEILVRPEAAPTEPIDHYWGRGNWAGYTEWIEPRQSTDFAGLPRPSGSCSGLVPGTATSIASAPHGGYWVASAGGVVSACGAKRLTNFDTAILGFGYGFPGGPLVENGPYIVSDPTGDGYWAVSGHGQVNAYGAAKFYGQKIEDGTWVTDAAPTITGKGYWYVSAFGKVSHFGDAGYYGSANVKGALVYLSGPGIPTVTPAGIVGIAPTEGDHGYVLVAVDGAAYGFGKHDGMSCGPVPMPRGVTVAGVAPDYRTGGYWVAETNGTVAACHAPAYAAKDIAGGPVAGIGALGDGLGYRLVTTGGEVYDFGQATFRGNAG